MNTKSCLRRREFLLSGPALLGCLALSGRTEEAAARPLKLLSWNIQMLPTVGSFASASLRKGQLRRAPWIIEYLCKQHYDTVALQEVIDVPITEMLKAGLKDAYPHIVAPKSQAGISGTTGGNLIASRIPLEYVTHIVFRNTRGVDTLAEKGCVLVTGEHSGVTFQLVATHLQAGHADVRQKQVGELAERVLEPQGREGVPQLLVGDLNIAKDAETPPTFDELLRITEMQAYPVDDPSPYTVDGRNSWLRDDHGPALIDHVLCNPRGTATKVLRQTIQRARHVPEDGRPPVDYADHYGVVAEVLLGR